MSYKKKLSSFIGLTLAFTFLPVALASAHVVVTPNEVATGADQLFTITAPSERSGGFTSLKLVLPAGITNVTPVTIAGWNIRETKSGDGDTAVVTDITWDSNAVPDGQKILLQFSAKMPASSTELDWKAYQTYSDGTVVAWDQKPTANEADNDAVTSGPFSITNVVSKTADMQQADKTTNDINSAKNSAKTGIYIAILALLGSVTALGFAVKIKK